MLAAHPLLLIAFVCAGVTTAMNLYTSRIHDHGTYPSPFDADDYGLKKGEAAALHAYRNQQYGHIQPHPDQCKAVELGSYNPKDLTSFHKDAQSPTRKQRAVQQMNSLLDPRHGNYQYVVQKVRVADAEAWKTKANAYLRHGNIVHKALLKVHNGGSSKAHFDAMLEELHHCNLDYADSKLHIERCTAQAESLPTS